MSELTVRIKNLSFVNLDKPLMEVSMFYDMGLEVVVVTGITLEQLKADTKLREALSTLLRAARPSGADSGRAPTDAGEGE